MPSSNFSFSIELPEHGWLPFHLTLGDNTVSFSASFVLEDPGAATVNAALSLLKYNNESVDISWWIEPNWHTMRIDRSLDTESLFIMFFENHRENHPHSEPTYFTTCSTTNFCQLVVSAFREVAESYGREAYEEGAGRPYPEERINEVYTELRNRANRES